MMNTLRLFNDEELRTVIGGKGGRFTGAGDALVGYDTVKDHFGQSINKYESEHHIGELVIAKTTSFFLDDDWYLGTLD